jgi:hypothetical protein
MAAYLRFNERTYAGRSRYRPGEGWIDVLLWALEMQTLRSSAGSSKFPVPTDGSVYVRCYKEPGVLHLIDAHERGDVHINSAVLEDWQGAQWRRIMMRDVRVGGVMNDHTKDGTPVVVLELQFQASTFSMGKQ